MNKRKLISLKEFLIIAAIAIPALCAYIFFGAGAAGTHAEIRMHNRVVHTVTLNEDKIFYLAPHPAVQFIVRGGRIAFYKSNCPDHICVRTGFLHLPGQIAVCMPNRVVLSIVGLADDVDFFLE